jgi:hypothetical protein
VVVSSSAVGMWRCLSIKWYIGKHGWRVLLARCLSPLWSWFDSRTRDLCELSLWLVSSLQKIYWWVVCCV